MIILLAFLIRINFICKKQYCNLNNNGIFKNGLKVHSLVDGSEDSQHCFFVHYFGRPELHEKLISLQLRTRQIYTRILNISITVYNKLNQSL